MIIEPKIRNFLCLTSHPTGCAANVQRQIDYVRDQGAIAGGARRVLVLGASTGYGLASRITCAFGCGASTLGVFFEKAGTEKKPATSGWYNSAAFHRAAEEDGLPAWSINGDAFSDAVKGQAIDLIRAQMEQVDLVVYSLAAPRRRHPDTGEWHSSTLKPVGEPWRGRGLNTDRGEVTEFSLEPATEEEVAGTVAVMGGEDWQRWMDALDAAGVLAPAARSIAYTYIGDRMTWKIYWHGTIGAAKRDLDQRVLGIREKLAARGGDARVCVLKAVVTQASSAIPGMSLYLSALFKVMKAEGVHEGCIEQVYGLFRDSLYGAAPRMDDEGRLRADHKELEPEIQRQAEAIRDQVSDENLHQVTDFAGYQREFRQLFGFDVDGVDYDAEVDPVVEIPGLLEQEDV